MSPVTQAMVINGVVLFAVLEADLGGHRAVGKLRLARPVLMAGAIVPLYLKALTTHGTGLALEIAGAVAGLVLGLAAVSLMTVHVSSKTGKTSTRAGVGYAALWTAVIGARAAFSYGSYHWFGSSLSSWMTRHDVSSAAITDTLILMAVAMVVTRTVGMGLGVARVRHEAEVTAAQGKPVLV